MEFDKKTFNAEVFEGYTKTAPNLRKNELLKAGVFKVRNDLRARFADQVGGNYIVEPIKARIGGTAVNYDGSTDIDSSSRNTYAQGKIVVGRANAWTEKDFSQDITGGVDFKATAREIAEYFDDIDQNTLLSILKGIFSMTGAANLQFVNGHTLDIHATEKSVVEQTTLNTAVQKACGDMKDGFAVAIMHSQVATNLENANLLQNLKYTDSQGIQRDLTLKSWNGRLVLIDDTMPTEGYYVASTDTEVNSSKDYYTKSNGAYTKVATPTGNPSTSSYFELVGEKYTTYILGKESFEFVDCGAKVPFEVERDAKTNGGETTLVGRQRKLFAPVGISFAPAVVPTSPTDAELAAGASWKLAPKASGSGAYPHKAINIARIISLG